MYIVENIEPFAERPMGYSQIRVYSSAPIVEFFIVSWGAEVSMGEKNNSEWMGWLERQLKLSKKRIHPFINQQKLLML